MADMKNFTFDDWAALAETELRGKPLAALTKDTPEGIAIKPVYTADDLPDTAARELPGFAPFTRGVRATMYTNRPPKKVMPFTAKTLRQGKRDYPSPLIWPPTGAMIVIIRACRGMLARPESPLTRWRI